MGRRLRLWSWKVGPINGRFGEYLQHNQIYFVEGYVKKNNRVFIMKGFPLSNKEKYQHSLEERFYWSLFDTRGFSVRD